MKETKGPNKSSTVLVRKKIRDGRSTQSLQEAPSECRVSGIAIALTFSWTTTTLHSALGAQSMLKSDSGFR